MKLRSVFDPRHKIYWRNHQPGSQNWHFCRDMDYRQSNIQVRQQGTAHGLHNLAKI